MMSVDQLSTAYQISEDLSALCVPEFDSLVSRTSCEIGTWSLRSFRILPQHYQFQAVRDPGEPPYRNASQFSDGGIRG